MRLQKIQIVFLLATFCSCSGQSNNKGSKFSVGQIDSLQTFSLLRPNEQRMDSLLHNTSWFNGTFKNNRSRIFLEEFKNGESQQVDSGFDTGLSAPCMCYLNNDTINIKTFVGFFGAFGFLIKIYKDDFNSQYIVSIDQDETYKSDSSASKFSNQAVVKNKIQKLILSTKPNFKLDEQITGVLEFKTNDYYEKVNETSVDTLFETGKIYFTCKTRKKTLLDQEP
jgi:hypothetical protein